MAKSLPSCFQTSLGTVGQTPIQGGFVQESRGVVPVVVEKGKVSHLPDAASWIQQT